MECRFSLFPLLTSNATPPFILLCLRVFVFLSLLSLVSSVPVFNSFFLLFVVQFPSPRAYQYNAIGLRKTWLLYLPAVLCPCR